MEKIIIVILLILIPILIFVYSTSPEYVIPTNPDISGFKNGYQDYGIGFETEQDYSRIIAFTEFETYTPDFDLINIIIKNENPGKGFYFFMTPFLEKIENGKWKRLKYTMHALGNESKWAFCGI